MIDVWMSAPLGSRTEAKRHFDTALDTFRLTPELIRSPPRPPAVGSALPSTLVASDYWRDCA